MSGILAPIQSILAKLSTLQVVNQDNQTVDIYARVFNNQRNRVKDGKSLAYPLPASFLEIISPETYNRLGNSVSESDLIFRIHLEHWFIDAQDGTYDQDLLIFDLRDKVISLLTDFRPTACGNLVFLAEAQDYDHDDVYVMMIDFICGFIDDRGTPEYKGEIITRPSPVNLDLEVIKVDNI